MRFEKWQALGNDYIVLERDALPFPLTPERAHAICDAHFGCHADGILLLSKPTDPEAHVAELRRILEHASGSSLVILDEVGSGTDPAEGGALAMAILEELSTR